MSYGGPPGYDRAERKVVAVLVMTAFGLVVMAVQWLMGWR
jgi:hypothetical protein